MFFLITVNLEHHQSLRILLWLFFHQSGCQGRLHPFPLLIISTTKTTTTTKIYGNWTETESACTINSVCYCYVFDAWPTLKINYRSSFIGLLTCLPLRVVYRVEPLVAATSGGLTGNLMVTSPYLCLTWVVALHAALNVVSQDLSLPPQCFDGILGSKVIKFSYFNVLGVIINQYQVMMTFKGEDVWSSHRPWQIRDRTWHEGLFLLCRRVVVSQSTVFYFVFYLSAHSRPIKRFPGPLFALHNSKVCSVY